MEIRFVINDKSKKNLIKKYNVTSFVVFKIYFCDKIKKTNTIVT